MLEDRERERRERHNQAIDSVAKRLIDLYRENYRNTRRQSVKAASSIAPGDSRTYNHELDTEVKRRICELTGEDEKSITVSHVYGDTGVIKGKGLGTFVFELTFRG
jgi:hypothetical protein